MIFLIDEIGQLLIEHSTRAKRLSIRVSPAGVRVIVPPGVSLSRGKDFARSKKEWIRHHVARMDCIAQEQAATAMSAPAITDRKMARARIVRRLQELSEHYDLPYERVMVRSQKTRWGSCSGRNTISLNIKLARLPEELMDYVILHELVHTRIKGHGKRFWSRLDTLTGEARKLSKELRRYSPVML
jgi:predicted metal-dependent hydrolase